MFITIEGPEGSGKTTAVDAAVKELEKMGYQIVRTREPGGTLPKRGTDTRQHRPHGDRHESVHAGGNQLYAHHTQQERQENTYGRQHPQTAV